MRYIATLGAADRYLAMHHALLGRFDVAFDAFARALDLELRFGSTTLVSQTRLAYAQALARAGQTAEAANQADAARRAAEETGVDFVIRRASELGSTLGRFSLSLRSGDCEFLVPRRMPSGTVGGMLEPGEDRSGLWPPFGADASLSLHGNALSPVGTRGVGSIAMSAPSSRGRSCPPCSSVTSGWCQGGG